MRDRRRELDERLLLCTYGIIINGLRQEEVAKYLFTVFGQFELLQFGTMIFEGENNRIITGDKGCISNGVDHLFEIDIGTHGLAMRDDGLSIVLAVPTI